MKWFVTFFYETKMMRMTLVVISWVLEKLFCPTCVLISIFSTHKCTYVLSLRTRSNYYIIILLLLQGEAVSHLQPSPFLSTCIYIGPRNTHTEWGIIGIRWVHVTCINIPAVGESVQFCSSCHPNLDLNHLNLDCLQLLTMLPSSSFLVYLRALWEHRLLIPWGHRLEFRILRF